MNNDNTSAGMTRFTDSNLYLDCGSYLTYFGPNGERKFVARFKLRRNARGFIKFLKEHFTVEEYFAQYETGKAPDLILSDKGYVSAAMKAALKRMGYAPNQEGLKAWDACINRGLGIEA